MDSSGKLLMGGRTGNMLQQPLNKHSEKSLEKKIQEAIDKQKKGHKQSVQPDQPAQKSSLIEKVSAVQESQPSLAEE